MKSLLIIPAYNEEASILNTLTELREKNPWIEFVVVNDGSVDATRELCESKGYPIINLQVNLGLSGAFRTGIMYAFEEGYDFAIQYDADGQHTPEAVAELLNCAMETDADIVIGSRFVSKSRGYSARMLGSILISGLIRLTTGVRINDPTSGLRLYNRKMMRLFSTRDDLTPEPETLSFLIKRYSIKIKEVQVTMRERMAGESYLNLSKSIRYMANALSSIIFSQWFRR